MSELFTSYAHGDPAGPIEGFYLHRRRGCVDMPVKVWFGPPTDPETGDVMDRCFRWQMSLAGDLLEDWDRVWPRCAGEVIDQAEYEYRMARIVYAREEDPDDPYGAVDGQIDLFTAPLPFGD